MVISNIIMCQTYTHQLVYVVQLSSYVVILWVNVYGIHYEPVITFTPKINIYLSQYPKR